MGLANNKSAKQYLIVLIANFLSMGLGFLINIIGTNIMATSSYGFYRAFISSLQMISSISILGFHYTLGRQFALLKTKEDKRLLNTASIIIIITLVLIALLIIQSASLVIQMIADIEMPKYIVLSSLFLYIMMFQYYNQQKLQGENRIFSLSLMTVLPQIFISIFFLAALMQKQFIEINLALTVFILSYTVVIVHYIFESGFKFNIKKELRRLIIENKKFGLQLYFGSLFSVTVAQFLGLFIAELSGLSEYAFYSLGVSLAAPMTLIASSMGTVRFKKNVYSDRISKKELLITFIVTISSLFLYYIFLNYILVFFISERYFKAISYANILIYYYTMMGMGDYLNRFVSSKGNGSLLRNGSIITGIVLIVSASILIPLYKVDGLIFAQIISSIVYMLTMFYYVKYISKK